MKKNNKHPYIFIPAGSSVTNGEVRTTEEDHVMLDKLADSVISTKFMIFSLSSVFLYCGKLSQDNWVLLAMTLAGFHTANTVTSIVKGVAPIIPRGKK